MSSESDGDADPDSIVEQYFEQRPEWPHRDEETLRVWHIEERMTPQEMADMWGINKNTVIDWLREYDLYRFDEDPEAYLAEHCG